MITSTLEGRVKLAYARGRTDEEIAQQENVSVEVVANILMYSRLPIGIKAAGITIDTNPTDPILRVIRWG